MDALVNSLMEELNCETVFTIPIFGGIPIYESVVVTWIIMAVVIVLCILLTRKCGTSGTQTDYSGNGCKRVE